MSEPIAWRTEGRAAAVREMRDRIAAADKEVFLTLPYDAVGEFESELTAAYERVDIVGLLLYELPMDAEPSLPDGIAHVVRAWETMHGNTVLCVDRTNGVFASSGVWRGDGVVISYEEPYLDHLTYTMFLAQIWRAAREILVDVDTTLPQSFRDFRGAVAVGTVLLQRGIDLAATIEARPLDGSGRGWRELTGRVLSTRQSLITPTNSSFFGESTLLVHDGEQRVTVGGKDAYVEDYESRSVVFHSPDRAEVER